MDFAIAEGCPEGAIAGEGGDGDETAPEGGAEMIVVWCQWGR